MKVTPVSYILYARKSSESEDKQVASIPAQVDELKTLAKQHNLRIAKILTEEKSAKAPDRRPIFKEMLSMIQRGDANGILCWKLDRLARNPVDGAAVNWMLQQGVIQHIQTYQRAYYPTDNVLMMQLEFGMANQFILDLSVNTKRGMRKKVEDGWFPHKPPIGYTSNKHKLPELPPIYKDPVKFPIVRTLWETIIRQRCTIGAIHKIAIDMGLKMPNGKPLSLSKCHELFRNPFYYGDFRWNGEIHKGNHEPMISKSLFDKAQLILDGRSFTCSKHHVFAFTGLMRCGECGAAITAENKTTALKTGNTRLHTYYRCTKRLGPCSQMPIREDMLEEQIKTVLGTINIPHSFHKWTIKQLQAERGIVIEDRESISSSQRQMLDACNKKIDELFEMRLANEITPQEFAVRRGPLLKEKHHYEELINDANKRIETWLYRAEEMLSFAETAKVRFERGDLYQKREILAHLAVKLVLMNLKLTVTLTDPLNLMQEVAPDVQAFHNRLEPLKDMPTQDVMEKLYAQNDNWGPLLNDVRTYLAAECVSF